MTPTTGRYVEVSLAGGAFDALMEDPDYQPWKNSGDRLPQLGLKLFYKVFKENMKLISNDDWQQGPFIRFKWLTVGHFVTKTESISIISVQPVQNMESLKEDNNHPKLTRKCG